MDEWLCELIEKMLTTTSLASDKLKFSDGVGITAANQIWNVLSLVGIGMTIIYFLIEMNRKLALEGRDMTLKSFFVPFLKLMIAIAVLSQGANIVSWILSLNNTLVDQMDGVARGITDANNDAAIATYLANWKKLLGDFTLLVKLLAALFLLLGYIISLVLQVVWWYKTITYKLEVLFRIGITPIALSDVYSGQNSNAIRWLKGFLALGLYACGMILMPKLASALMVDEMIYKVGDFWTALNGLAMCIVTPLAALGTMSMIRQATKEALGA